MPQTTDHLSTVKTVLTNGGISPVYLGDFNADDPDDLVRLMTAGGATPGHFIGTTDTYDQQVVNIRVRNKDEQTAYNTARTIAGLFPTTPSGYVAVRLQGGITLFGTDDQERHTYALSVVCQIVE